jgi:3-oxoacyl-[acyl-carrier protein] reductase
MSRNVLCAASVSVVYVRELMEDFRPIGGRMGRPSDVADAAEYFASDIAGWVSGQHLLISGGAQQ